MERETGTAGAIRRIAAELGVHISCFYEQNVASSCEHEALQKAIAALLSAFATVRDPEERQRSVAHLSAEAKRLRALGSDSER